LLADAIVFSFRPKGVESTGSHRNDWKGSDLGVLIRLHQGGFFHEKLLVLLGVMEQIASLIRPIGPGSGAKDQASVELLEVILPCSSEKTVADPKRLPRRESSSFRLKAKESSYLFARRHQSARW